MLNLDAILDAIARGQKQHRHLVARRPHQAQHIPAIQARHHHVENQQVIGRTQRMLQRVGAAGDTVDRKAGLAQSLLQVHAGFRFVFSDQQFHGGEFLRWRRRKCGSARSWDATKLTKK